MRYLIFGLLILLALAHQDFWWRSDYRTVLFGVLPVSLAYHICISIAASVLWGLACYYCWPSGVDIDDAEAAAPGVGPRPD